MHSKRAVGIGAAALGAVALAAVPMALSAGASPAGADRGQTQTTATGGARTSASAACVDRTTADLTLEQQVGQLFIGGVDADEPAEAPVLAGSRH